MDAEHMSVFKRGEKVKIVESENRSQKTYIIKKIFKSDDGIILYLLKSEKDQVMRLYYENQESSLERVV